MTLWREALKCSVLISQSILDSIYVPPAESVPDAPMKNAKHQKFK